MKWIMIVMICWGANCQTMYEEALYDTEQKCLDQAQIVSEYAQKTYPNSEGKVYCLNEKDFGIWLNSIQSGTDA